MFEIKKTPAAQRSIYQVATLFVNTFAFFNTLAHSKDVLPEPAASLQQRIHKSSDMGVSKNSGTPKSSILIGISIINHPLWGTPIFGNTHIPS